MAHILTDGPLSRREGGGMYVDPNQTPVELMEPSMEPAQQSAALCPSGWECPRCRRVWAPSVLACHHCPEPPAFIAKVDDPGLVWTAVP
jgi:hypothetical protein